MDKVNQHTTNTVDAAKNEILAAVQNILNPARAPNAPTAVAVECRITELRGQLQHLKKQDREFKELSKKATPLLRIIQSCKLLLECLNVAVDCHKTRNSTATFNKMQNCNSKYAVKKKLLMLCLNLLKVLLLIEWIFHSLQRS